jgi:hypothetical protein
VALFLHDIILEDLMGTLNIKVFVQDDNTNALSKEKKHKLAAINRQTWRLTYF